MVTKWVEKNCFRTAVKRKKDHKIVSTAIYIPQKTILTAVQQFKTVLGEIDTEKQCIVVKQ